jgi:hypothetical protein
VLAPDRTLAQPAALPQIRGMKRRISYAIAAAPAACRPSAWLLSSAVLWFALSAAAQTNPQTTATPATSSPPPTSWAQLPAWLSVPPAPSLPLVPSLRLTAPTLLVPSPGQAQGDTLPVGWLNYWQTASVPSAWRYVPDEELRLRVETAHWQLDRLSFSAGMETAPEQERPCFPTCAADADWDSNVVLKYDGGDVGPLQQTGPMVQLGGKPRAQGVQERSLVRVGLSGAF